jgi:hypothetical protein
VGRNFCLKNELSSKSKTYFSDGKSKYEEILTIFPKLMIYIDKFFSKTERWLSIQFILLVFDSVSASGTECRNNVIDKCGINEFIAIGSSVSGLR